MTYSRIVGTGRYLPERVMTNFDLEKIVDTSDEWIRTRTGVERRHVVRADQTTSDMCVEAAKNAMDAAGVTSRRYRHGDHRHDVARPDISQRVDHHSARLGIPACTAFSLEAACTGFIYALTTRTSSSRRAKPSALWSWAPSASPSSSTGVIATPVCCLATVPGRRL